MNKTKIRLATMDDYDIICRLLEQVDRHHVAILPEFFQSFSGPPRSREVVAAYVEGQDADYILAEVDEAIVGLIDIKKDNHPNYPMFKPYDFAMIGNIVVDEGYRRQGVATALFEEAKRWAKRHGLKSIRLTVWIANTSAMEFYKKQGFQPLTEKMELKLE